MNEDPPPRGAAALLSDETSDEASDKDQRLRFALPFEEALAVLLDTRAGPRRRALVALRLIDLEAPLPDAALEALLVESEGRAPRPELRETFCFCEDCMRAGGLPPLLPFALARGPLQVALAKEALLARSPEDRAELLVHHHTHHPSLDEELGAWLYERWHEEDRGRLPEARSKEVAEASAAEPRSLEHLRAHFARTYEESKHELFALMPLHPELSRALRSPEERREAMEALAFPLALTLEALGPEGLERQVRRAALAVSWDRRCPIEPKEDQRRRQARLIRGLHLLRAWGEPGSAAARAILATCTLHPDLRGALEQAALGKMWRP